MARGISFDIDERGCFVCTSHKQNKDGYRQIVVNGNLYIMHRLIYQECYGDIPEGYVVRHKCDNTHCINPEHLEIGTPKDNTQDMIDRGRKVNCLGEDHGRNKLKINQAFEIYKRSQEGHNLRVLAEQFGVEKSTVFKIKKGETWKHARLMFEVLHDVEKERKRQNELWDLQRHDYGKWLAILGEEFGEVCEAMQGSMGLVSVKDTDADNLYEELIHLAAVASAIAEQVREENGTNKIVSDT